MMPSPDMSFPVPLIHISETNSTNSYLQALCSKQQGVAAFTTVVADFQTSGRGQRGNSWESEPKKNLLFSFVLFPDFLRISKMSYCFPVICRSDNEFGAVLWNTS